MSEAVSNTQIVHKPLAAHEEQSWEIEYLASLAQCISDAIISTDMNFNIRSWNEAAEALYGWKKDEVIGKSVFDLIPVDYPGASREELMKLVFARGYWKGEVIHKRRDGTRLTIFAATSLVKDSTGNVIGLVSVNRDITAARRAEEMQQASEKRFRAMIENSADAIALVDMQGAVVYASPSTERMLGYAPEELLGRLLFEFIHPDDLTRVVTVFAGILGEPGRSLTVEYRLRHKDGSWRWMEGSGTNLLHDPAVGAIVGNHRDITERHLVEEEREQLERRKDDFISMASHELKTPVTSIKAFTQVLKRQFEKEQRQEPVQYLARMDVQIDKLTKLISDLLDISKISAGQLEFTEERFDFDQFLREIVEDVQDTSTKHRISVSGSAKREIVADKDRLGQVFINLLTNAIKYSPNADKVIVEVSAGQDEVTVSVRDFGLGISREHQAHIFERFYRVNDSKDRTFPGLGIGLYISSEIVRRHGGRLWVESVEGQGATFYVALPFGKIDEGL